MDYAGSMDFYEVTGAGAERQSGFFIIAEVIALPDMLDFRVQLKTETLMEFCSYRGFGLLLTDGWHISKGLLNGKVNRKLEKELVAAQAHNPLPTIPMPGYYGEVQRDTTRTSQGRDLARAAVPVIP